MKNAIKRALTAALATVISAVTLSFPAAAVTEDAALHDYNGDGVIDVFDYVLHKRAIVDESTPIDFALGDAAAAPGEIATVSGVISSNTGFSYANFVLYYPEDLNPAQLRGAADFVIPNEALFPEVAFNVTVVSARRQMMCAYERNCYSEENGILFDISFRVPEDAEVGDVYQLEFRDLELRNGREILPVLAKRGTITVIEPEEPPVTEPSTEITTTTTTTTTTTESTTTTTSTTAESTTAAATTTTTTAETSATTTTTTSTVTTTETTTTAAETTTYKVDGIDVSVYQGEIDYRKLRDESANQFVIIRAGFGRQLYQEDKRFQSNYNGAKAAGIPVGAYWYSYANSAETARIEANVCAQVLGNRQFEYPIAFDIEEPSVLALGKTKVGEIINAFCSELESKGYFVTVYCSRYYFENAVPSSITQRYDTWLAEWKVAKPKYTGPFGIWQYGSVFDCPGIDAEVDVDYSYRDYPAIIKEKHLNGF